MEIHECNLNIRYDLPKEVLDKLREVYSKMPGWQTDEVKETAHNIPFWFNEDENKKHVFASIEPSGLHFEAYMEIEEWISWKTQFKRVASEILRFKVGEIEEGEVGDEIEWL